MRVFYKKYKGFVILLFVTIVLFIMGIFVIRDYKRISNLTAEDLQYRQVIITSVTHDYDDDEYYIYTKNDDSFTVSDSRVKHYDLQDLKETDTVIIGTENGSHSLATLKVNGQDLITFEQFQKANKRNTLAFVIIVPIALIGVFIVMIYSGISTKKKYNKEREDMEKEEINMNIYNEVLEAYHKENGNHYFSYKEKFIGKFQKSVNEALMSLINENEVTYFHIKYDNEDNNEDYLMLLYKRNKHLYFEELLKENLDHYVFPDKWEYPLYLELTEEEKEQFKVAFEYSKAMYPELFNK